ncbi:MAG: phosphoglycerate dehydrogenase [Oscillospiraceae bacterium]|nr:phosphoglycerate dehydrogenase [Oscillospiraceae bacterium]
MKALIIDAIHSCVKEEMSKYMTVETRMLPTQAQLKEIIGDVDVLLMRVDPAINKEILDAAKNLKIIAVCAVGLNHVDLEYAKEKGVQVFNAPGWSDNAVAELTISKMLDISRGAMQANREVKDEHVWNKYKYYGRELRGKTLGILGFGRIGRRVARFADVFEMKVLAYDPYVPEEVFEQNYATGASKEEVLRQSDFVTIHLPLLPETKDLISAETIKLMKKDAVVLNMSRGSIVNEKDMYDALVAGDLAGYASDVMESELVGGGLVHGAGFDSPLFTLENFIVSPHIGAQTQDAAYLIGQDIIGKIKGALDLK